MKKPCLFVIVQLKGYAPIALHGYLEDGETVQLATVRIGKRHFETGYILLGKLLVQAA